MRPKWTARWGDRPWGWVLLGAIYCLALALVLSFGETLSNSVDMGFHLQTAELLGDHLIMPESVASFQREMFAYPRWSYRLAAPAIWAGLSSPNALGLAATTSVAGVWLILLATARRVSQAAFVWAFLCAAATVVFLGATFGAEVIVNYFYPQVVGEPFAVGFILLGAYLIGRSRLAFVILALVAIWVCGQFHLIAALRAAGGLAVVLTFYVARSLIQGRPRATAWLLALPAMAGALLLNPAFAAMRGLSVVNGGIGFARPLEMGQIETAALALLFLSTAILIHQLRRPSGDTRREPALIFFAALGAGTAAAALAQAAAFAWFGESSPYAVKKHAFGVFTALAFVAPIAAGLAASARPALTSGGWRRTWAILAAAGVLAGLVVLARRTLGLGPFGAMNLFDQARFGLAGLAMVGLLAFAAHVAWAGWRLRPEPTAITLGGVVAAHLAILQLLFFRPGVIDAPRLSSLVEDTAAVREAAASQGGFLFNSSSSSVVVNFLVNMAALQLDRGSDRNYAGMLWTNDVLRPELAPNLVTEVGDPTYDAPGCRRAPPRGAVVLVDGACVAEAIYDFRAGGAGVRLLGEGWSVPERDWVWSDGPRAVIELPLPEAMRQAQSPRVVIKTIGYVPLESPRRTVHVAIEGGPSQTYVFDATISGDFAFRLDIPPEAVRRGAARIVFAIDNPEIADPAAPRRLGVALERLVLYPKVSPPAKKPGSAARTDRR